MDYDHLIARARKDARLQLGDFNFYVCLLNLISLSGTDHLHCTMRDYMREVHLSMGAISNAIPRLIEYGYIRGGLYPNDKGHQSWRLYLADSQVGTNGHDPGAKQPLAIHSYRYGQLKITITIDETE